MRLSLTLSLLLVALFTTGCERLTAFMESDDSSAWSPGSVIYANSFETAADTMDWYGNGTMRLRSEPAPDGGSQSVCVAGACIIPHSAYDLSVAEDADLVLRAFGKNLAIGGGIVLRNMETNQHIGMRIESKKWKQQQSKDTLHVEAGTTLQLSMSSGGFVASAMLVDRLEVVRVDQ